MPGAADPNRAILTRVARALGALCDELVFVGGCATGLLVTSVRAQVVRMTEDVDLVAQVATVREYHDMEARIQALVSFTICRPMRRFAVGVARVSRSI